MESKQSENTSGMLTIEIIYALPEEQNLKVISVSDGTNVKEAIEASGLLEIYPEIDLDKTKVGIFSKVTKLDELLRDGDRIEIYRPLIADPKEMQRKKALQKQEQEKKEQEKVEEQFKDFADRLKEVLKEDVEEVRITHRLTDSPACLVVGEHDMGAQMRRLLEQAGQAVPSSKPTIEINPEHPLVQKMDQESDEDRFADFAHVVFDQANLAEGGSLKDPAAYVRRLNKLLLEISA